MIAVSTTEATSYSAIVPFMPVSRFSCPSQIRSLYQQHRCLLDVFLDPVIIYRDEAQPAFKPAVVAFGITGKISL